MINWMILGVALAAISIVSFVLECREFYGWTLFVGVIAAAAAAVILICCPIVRVSNKSECGVFAQQKAYIESHIAENAIEDATLTTRKLN